MSAKILNGKEIAKQQLDQIKKQIHARTQSGHRAPVLAVILVGKHRASTIYVERKRLACRQIGIVSKDYDLAETTSQAELLHLINKLNNDTNIDGILVQLPLPKQIDPNNILESIDYHKDVDGFHPYNLGLLAQGRNGMRPCTPAGIMDLLQHTQEPLAGKKATVIGTSNIVGLPMVLELIRAGVTVTACQVQTVNLQQEIINADIIIAATGNPELIKGAWIKPGCIVIDVGMNHTKEGKLIGDVEFDSAAQRASWITPVPGGVGPMTIANLLNNTLIANINREKQHANMDKKS